MKNAHWFKLALALTAFVMACDGSSTGCGAGVFTTLPQGSFTGVKNDSSGALRLTNTGFTVLNQNSTQILNLFAPGNQLEVPLNCSLQSVNILGFSALQMAVADEGELYCNSETCGLMDGRCDSKDLGKNITINFSSLSFAPKAPDILEATVTATVATGLIHISTVSRNSGLCLFQNPAKCTVDFDTARAMPTDNELKLNIKLAIDQRWDKLLSLQVADIGGSKVCGTSGAGSPPACLDPADVVIANAGPCTTCTAANFSVVKTLILDQITNSLVGTINDALAEANCASCENGGQCPTSGTSMSTCKWEGDAGQANDAGTCIDTTTNKCVPAALGVEGQMNLGTALAKLGAPSTAALQLSLAAGGSSAASSAGITLGLRGGTKAVAVSDCVKVLTRPTPLALGLPDLDQDAPGPYDIGLSMSGQFMTAALFDAHQAGALCLELGNETISQLDSSLLGTLLPSLNKITDGKSVPLRIIIRPVNAPSVVVGEGTFNTDGTIKDPLLRLNWKALELDVYAQIEDRYARLFTVVADLSLPVAMKADVCDGVTPVLGDLGSAITNVDVINSDILAEQLDALKRLVPLLLTFAEPALAGGFQAITLPEIIGFQPQVLSVRGAGNISGTATYNHMAFYARAVPTTNTGCTMRSLKTGPQLQLLGADSKKVRLLAADRSQRYSWRIAQGFWSAPVTPAADGTIEIRHPKLMLKGPQLIEVKASNGGVSRVQVGAPAL